MSAWRLVLGLGLLGLGVGGVGAGLLVYHGLHDDLAPSDIALVLGNKVELDGRPSPRLQARLDRALDLFRAGYFHRIVVSGGTGREGFDEAAVMADYLASHGVPRDRIVTDANGNNTLASAQFTREFLRSHQLTSVLVISQYDHVPRARLALRRGGVPTIHSAHAYLFEWRDLYSIPRELAGYIQYSCRRTE